MGGGAVVLAVAAAATLVLLFTAKAVAAFRDDDVGETIPQRHEMIIGESVNISCIFNPINFNISNPCKMHFIEKDTKSVVPEADILQMNATYIIYMMRNAANQSSTFFCQCGDYAISQSSIYVGFPPSGVTQFDCRSYDFEYMVCNFTLPENPVLTQYNLSYYINSPDYETPVNCNFDMKPLVVCNITTDQSYRPHIDEYRFKVHSSNVLGNLKQEFLINNLNVMIPARPGNEFRVHKLSTDSVEVHWSMPKYDSYIPNKHRGLQWEVHIQPVGFPVRDINSEVRVVRGNCKLIINDLPYAHYWYDLSIRVKVRTAADSEDMWSPTFKYRFRTHPREPVRPPRTDNGSFYINPLRTEVRLYWEQLKKWEENGDNFTYVISGVKKDTKGKESRLLPLQQEASFAVYEWSKDSHYFFNISSRNHIGESLSASFINIHPQTRSHKEYTPISIHNAYHQTNRSYTLTWVSPPRRMDLANYTVYWCYSKLAMPTECRGSIHFRHVPSDTHRFATDPQMTEHDHSLTLAVSANYYEYNTGMHWTSCSVDVNADFEPMEPEIQAISATDLRVQWSSKTICPSILNGYNLTYCEVINPSAYDGITPPNVGSGLFETFPSGKIVSSEVATCINGTSITITIDKNLNKCNITGLKPYTLYRMEMFMFSNTKFGKASEPLLVPTLEAAPTPPRQLKVSELTAKSATISWLPPSQSNGYIRKYIVHLNNKEYTVNAAGFNSAEEINFLLQNLTSFVKYKVFVVAFTAYKSKPSNDIDFITYMSAPLELRKEASENINKMEVQLKWIPPTIPGGRLDYYEVNVTQLRGDYLERQRISYVFGTSCLLRIPTCPDRDYQTKVEVRAVNAAVIKDNEVDPKDLVAQQTRNKFNHDRDYYDGNDDLVCVGATDSAMKEKHATQWAGFHNTTAYLLYKSSWYSLTNFGCAPPEIRKITTITLMVLSTSVMMMALMVFATKKVKMMSDIHVQLPDALDAYLKKDVSGGAGGGGGVCGLALANGDVGSVFGRDFNTPNAHLPTLTGSNERLHNEEHHLLGTHDSGYIGDGLLFGRSISAVATSVSADDDSSEEGYGRREYLNSESSADSLIGSTNSSAGGGAMAAEVEAAPDVVMQAALPLKRIVEEASGYVQVPQADAVAQSGYVTTADWNAWAQAKSSVAEESEGSKDVKDGYIQAAALTNGRQLADTKSFDTSKGNATAALGGYITSSELTKMTQPTATVSAAAKEIVPASHSGYIKPADLNAASNKAWSQQANQEFRAALQSDYIKASDLYGNNAARLQTQIQQQPQKQQQHPITTAPTSSGYVTVDSLTAMAPKPPNTVGMEGLGTAPAKQTPAPTPMLVNSVVSTHNDKAQTMPSATTPAINQPSSAYVQPSTLQQLLFPTPATTGGVKSINSSTANTNFSGYTTLESLSKLTSTQGGIENPLSSPQLRTAQSAAGGKAGLIGYVTQREMNEFGQQQHPHEQQMH